MPSPIASLRRRTDRARARAALAALCCAIAATGCGGRARAVGRPVADGDAQSFEVSRGSIKRRADRTASAPVFWSAVAQLDCDQADKGAHTLDERMFAGGFRALLDGRAEDALVYFGGLRRSTDPTVRAAATTGRVLALELRSRWGELAEPGPDSVVDRAAIEVWARAFAPLPATTFRIPAQSQRLPLRMSTVGTPVITVRINGSDRNFWLDTGASLTIIAADVARELGVPAVIDDTLAVATWAGRVPARPGVIDKLQLGDVLVRHLPVAILDERALQFERPSIAHALASSDDSFHLDGVIGTDVLRKLAITLDVRARTLVVARPPNPRAGAPRNLYWIGFPVLRLTTGSGRPALLGLDTGADSSTVGETWFLVDTTGHVKARRSAMVGLGATTLATTQAVNEVAVTDGDYTVRLRNVTIAPDRRSTFITMDAVLGSDFIRSAEVHLDFANGIFSVRPSKPAPIRNAIEVTSQ